MSTVYIIKDGVIVSRTIANASYRDSRGVTVKPRTYAEEQELLRLSQNNERIKALRAEVEALKSKLADTDCARRLEEMLGRMDGGPAEKRAELEAAWNEARTALPEGSEAREIEASRLLHEARRLQRETLQKEAERRKRVSTALEKTAALRRDADKLTTLLFRVDSTAGTETVDAQVDSRTAGQLTKFQRRIEEISADLVKEDADVSEALQKEMEDMTLSLQALPEKAREVFTAELWRQEQAQNVCDRLLRSGWQIRQKFVDGDLFDDVSFAVENAAGDRAMISFSIEGDVHIDSQFSGPGGTVRREDLKQAVLGALIEGGAEAPRGKCMDETPEETQDQAASQSDSPAEEEAKTRVRRASGKKQTRQDGV